MLLVANLANAKNGAETWKMTETLANGYSSESTQQELSNEYQHDRVQMFFKNLCIPVLWMKVASAFEGLTHPMLRLTFRPKHNDTKIFEKHHKTLSCCYSLDSSRWVLSGEYPCMCQGLSHFSTFLHDFVLAKLATSSIRVKYYIIQCLFNLFWNVFRIQMVLD